MAGIFTKKCAFPQNNYGSDNAHYIGCRDTGELSDALYAKILSRLNIKTFDLPEGGASPIPVKIICSSQSTMLKPATVELPGIYRNLETE